MERVLTCPRRFETPQNFSVAREKSAMYLSINETWLHRTEKDACTGVSNEFVCWLPVRYLKPYTEVPLEMEWVYLPRM